MSAEKAQTNEKMPVSVLFRSPSAGVGPESPAAPSFFRDLNLNQVLEAMVVGKEEYDLSPFFCLPLSDEDSIRFRHEVMKDVRQEKSRSPIESFARDMREARLYKSKSDKLSNRYQKMSWLLDAAQVYCTAVESLKDGLSASDLTSRGMRAFYDYLEAYVGSDAFVALRKQARRLEEDLANITYRIHADGLSVTVGRYEDEPDYGADVETTFRRFQESKMHAPSLKTRSTYDIPEMNGVEEQILELVVALHPEVFGRLSTFASEHAEFFDETIRRFDREIQFYLAYLALIEPLEAAGLTFDYPVVDSHSKEVSAEKTFDLALGLILVREQRSVVCNDFYLQGPERIFVVSGPNQGGKTTFARSFGQLHYLARLGLPTPGRSSRLFLCDDIYTHFEREEHIETLRGKLQDELVRMHDILERADEKSIVIANEVFSSTSLGDALFLGKETLRRTVEIGCLGVYVTFIDELSRLDKALVSAVSTVDPEDPARRTFKIVRRPADGRAYAKAIAEKYGLTKEQVGRRLAR